MRNLTAAAMTGLLTLVSAVPAAANVTTQLYWGDTHLHTSYSFDAFLNQNESADPDTAYRWAKGLPVIHPYNRARVQIETPLDFLVVSDHAEALGVLRAVINDRQRFGELSFWDEIKRWASIQAIRLARWTGYSPLVFKDQLPLSRIARLLGVSRQTLHRTRGIDPDLRLVRAIRLQLGLRRMVAPVPSGTFSGGQQNVEHSG